MPCLKSEEAAQAIDNIFCSRHHRSISARDSVRQDTRNSDEGMKLRYSLCRIFGSTCGQIQKIPRQDTSCTYQSMCQAARAVNKT